MKNEKLKIRKEYIKELNDALKAIPTKAILEEIEKAQMKYFIITIKAIFEEIARRLLPESIIDYYECDVIQIAAVKIFKSKLVADGEFEKLTELTKKTRKRFAWDTHKGMFNELIDRVQFENRFLGKMIATYPNGEQFRNDYIDFNKSLNMAQPCLNQFHSTPAHYAGGY